MKQLTVFGDEVELKRSVSAEAKAKKNFLARFQRWCDREGETEYSPLGVCGWGQTCNYCADSSAKTPCAKALNSRIKEEGLVIDYVTADPADWW